MTFSKSRRYRSKTLRKQHRKTRNRKNKKMNKIYRGGGAITNIAQVQQSWNNEYVKRWDVIVPGVSWVEYFRFEGKGIGNGGFKTYEELLNGLKQYFDNTGNIKKGVRITEIE